MTGSKLRTSHAAIALLRGELYPPPEREASQIDKKVLDRYVGVYETEKGVFTITWEGPEFFLRKNKNPKKGEILRETSTVFLPKGDPVTLSFDPNSDGVVVDRVAITPPAWLLTVAQKRL